MRPRPLTILLLLFAGAVVNVGVAWGLALAPNRPGDWPSKKTRYVRIEPPVAWFVTRFERTGVLTISGTSRFNTSSLRRDTGTVILVPLWARLDPPPKTVAPGVWVVHVVRAYGWPCIALCYDVRAVGPSLLFDTSNAILLARPKIQGASLLPVKRALPLRLRPAGFLINTLFYATLAWLLFWFAPTRARRHLRARHGLCPACGYPVGEAAVCSECGARIQPARSVAE